MDDKFKVGSFYLIAQDISNYITAPVVIEILSKTPRLKESKIFPYEFTFKVVHGTYGKMSKADTFLLGSAFSHWPWKELGNSFNADSIKILYAKK